MLPQLLFETTYNTLLTLIFFVLLYFVLYLLERFFPAEKNQSLKGRLRNVWITAIYLFLGTLSYTLIFQNVSFEFRSLSVEGYVTTFFMALAVIFTADVLFYWYHRLEHRSKILWQIHVLHHSDTALNATTSYRTYFLEIPLQSLVISIPASFIFGDFETNFAMITLIKLVWEFFTHANLRLHMAGLTPVLCGPQVHRIHHSIEDKHRDKNFAQYFPFIDIVFGTYYKPTRNEFPKTGTPDMPSDVSFRTILFHPFVSCFKLARERARKTSVHG